MKFSIGASLVGVLMASTVPSLALASEPVGRIELITRPQSVEPAEFQSAQLVALQWRLLGLEVNVRTMPWEQLLDNVWYQREKWDTAAWRMVARPERSDPDEVLFNMFNSSTMEKGYNFIGYHNPEYDKVSASQRTETDPVKRRELVKRAQALLAADQPDMMLAHPKVVQAFDNTIWRPGSVVNASGIGISNYWTFVSITPKGDQKDIILPSSNNVVAVNPLYYGGPVDNWITELIYDRLVRVGPDGLPRPSAAESYAWKDERTLTVTLREGMTWHDGEPVTPEDVVYSFEAIQTGEAPYYTPFVANIERVSAEGREITFTLKQPSASFVVSSLGKINLLPKHIWAPLLDDLGTRPENAETVQEDSPVGSGPYRFERWLRNEEVVLRADHAHFDAPKADRWILRIVPNAEATMGMLRSGQINFLGDFRGDPDILKRMAEEDGDIDVVETVDMAFAFVAFNNRHAPFDDPAFRKALSAAVDRNMIVQGAYRGYAVPSNSPISPALDFWHNADLLGELKTGQDVAMNILTDAGYTLEGGVLHYPDGKDSKPK